MEELIEKAVRTRHIILTGHRHVGKSTLLQKLLGETTLPVSGFYTKKAAPDCVGICESYIYDAAAGDRSKSRENLIGTCSDSRLLECFPEVFDTLGLRYLRAHTGGLLVMDEIGFMESKAMAFQKEILSLFAEERPILAVVKDKGHPFLDQLRGIENAACVTVNEENRNALFELLAPVVSAWKE